MKKLFLILAIALSAQLHGQAEPKFSNTIGMIKLTLTKGQLSIVHNPFDSPNGMPVTIIDVLGDALPNGSRVFFRGEDQVYRTETYKDGAWQPGTTVINHVNAMFVSVPDDAPKDEYTLVVKGDVPDGAGALETVISLAPNYTLTAYPYPIAIKLVDANLPAKNGDLIYFWKDNAWVAESYLNGSWQPGTSSFEPGKGFYYLSSDESKKEWTALKPYTLDESER